MSDAHRSEHGLHAAEEQLTAYLLGELPEAEMDALDLHLQTCRPCQETLARLDQAFVAAVESLPDEPPPPEAWRAIEVRVAHAGAKPSAQPYGRPSEVSPSAARQDESRRSARRDRGAAAERTEVVADRSARPWAAGMAASLLLAASLGAWGAWQRQEAQLARAELRELEARVEVLEGTVGTVQARADTLVGDQLRVGRWLAHQEITTVRIPAGDDGVSPGSVLFHPDGRALLVMRDVPDEGQDFQAWGVRGDEVTSLGTFDELTTEVDAAGFEAVAVSLEPDGGSETPTEVLGAASAS